MKKYFLLISVTSVSLTTFIIGLTHYDSTNSPDFGRYFFSYNGYYVGNLNQTGLEQGNIYFYLVSKFISLRSHLMIQPFTEEYISYNIQLVNFLIFVLGMVFIYCYLKELNIDIKTITLILVALNFFPPLYALRLIYKPEILLFLLFFIALFLIEKNYNTNKTYFLYLQSICIALMVSIKLVSAAILVVFLVFKSFMRTRNNLIRNYKKFTLVFILTFLILSYENFLLNGHLFFDHKTPLEFQNKADFTFLFTLEIGDLLNKPYQHNFKNSAIGIILLETFDDYFNIYWNNDKSLFNLGQISIFKMQYTTQYLAIFLTLIFYLLVIIFSYLSKKHRFEILSPFLGIFLVICVSFFIQFNPNTGDQIKTYYYSSFLVLAFIHLILVARVFVNSKVFILLLILQIIIASYIVGFPKEYSSNMETKIINQLLTTDFCKIIELNIDFPNNKNCIDQNNICELSFKYNLSPKLRQGMWYFKLSKPPEFLIMKNTIESLRVNNINECNEILLKGYKIYNKNFYNIKKGPSVSIFTFFTLLVLSFGKRKVSIFSYK